MVGTYKNVQTKMMRRFLSQEVFEFGSISDIPKGTEHLVSYSGPDLYCGQTIQFYIQTTNFVPTQRYVHIYKVRAL